MFKKYVFCLFILFGVIVSMFYSVTRAEESLEYGYYLAGAHYHPEVPRINAFVAKKLFDQGKLILANAMESANFRGDHLLGSISIAADELHKWDNRLPHGVIIAFYCN
ncbi:MAG: hypothetical protein A2Y97_13730 [Nitrospirae bacterium RBG_13_39_12]|nr:MAG: hypothetical protein A2Y97_13730 [Nitrospirae bacterium RBG_13_39_12]